LAERPQIVALNKIDRPESQANIARLRKAIDLPARDVFEISAATRSGVDPLVQSVAARLADMPLLQRDQRDETLTWPVPAIDPTLFTIEPERRGWRVRGKRIERLISMTNFAQQDSLMRVQRVMEASGINTALRTAGVQEGDLVYIEKAALNWSDEG
jgi:GTP-binding protein